MSPAEAILHSAGVRAPSDIDLEALAWIQGAVIRLCPLRGCEAQIRGLGDHAVIRVNDSLAETRKRFSIAHELGHWQLHRGKNFRCAKNQIGNPTGKASDYEREADGFAADFIMPNYLFRPSVAEIGQFSAEAIRELAKIFRTSVDSALIKLIDSDLHPMVLVAREGSRRRWFRHTASTRGGWFLKEALPDLPSIHSSTEHRSRSMHQQKRPSSDWFDAFPRDFSEVTEINFFRGGATALTILLPSI